MDLAWRDWMTLKALDEIAAAEPDPARASMGAWR